MSYRVILTVLLSLILASALPETARAQGADLWTFVQTSAISVEDSGGRQLPARYLSAALDTDALSAITATAPIEFSIAAADGPTITLPMPDGTLGNFRIVESPIMAPELATQFPGLQTYSGSDINDPSVTARFDWSPSGLHGMIMTAVDTVIIEPYETNPALHYTYYKRDSTPVSPLPFVCGHEPTQSVFSAFTVGLEQFKLSTGASLRTFRLAMTATGEYTAFHGGTVASALAAIVTTVNRVNLLYERDFAIRFTLVADQSKIIYTDSATDPFSTEGHGDAASLDENQAAVDAQIGDANYDLGHIMGVGEGGLASAGLCETGFKAQGTTALDQPIGDAFDIDFVAHEIGHQLGGNHSFNNSTLGNCTTRNAATAFEPGSGSTVMGYAGICDDANLQPRTDDYFHAGSLIEIGTFLNQGDAALCGGTIVTNNTAPTVSAGTAFTIPRSTPFTLTATGSDPDGDALTYTWEQVDVGTAAPPEGDDASRPIFRSFPPSISPSRTFPQLPHILNSANVPPETYTLEDFLYVTGESLPTTARSLNFRVVARDNRAGGGGVADSLVTIAVDANTGPFAVQQPNFNLNWAAGASETVTWDVGGTTAAPVSAANVNVLLSTDGGLTFPTVLVSNTANTGTTPVTVPDVATSTARIKVEAVDNVFFDVSDANFAIVGGAAPGTTATPAFTVATGGGGSLSTDGSGGTTAGYVRIEPSVGDKAPAGLAIFGFRQNGVLVTEAGVTASPRLRSARFFANVSGPVNTGVAIANPNEQVATITFFFTDTAGTSTTPDTFTIPANGQIAAFLNQSPFNGAATFEGTFTFSSSVDVAAIALRGLTNERADFLITTLPIVDLGRPAVNETLTFSHFADGGGWTTQVVLVNPTDNAIAGTVRFYSQGDATTAGAPVAVQADGQSASEVSYSIPARSARRISTDGVPAATQAGSIRVVPSGSDAAPSGLGVFSFSSGGVTVSEAGVPALRAFRSQRMYAQLSGPVQTGVAIANPSAVAVTATVNLSDLTGTFLGTSTLTIPANGQTAKFLNQLPGFESLADIEGVLQITTDATTGLSVVGLRARTNERDDFLITTTPPVDESTTISSAELFFPHIVNGGGYTTQFVLFGNTPTESSDGTLRLFTQAGGPLSPSLN